MSDVPLVVRFAEPLTPESQALMDTLGIRVIIDSVNGVRECEHGRAEYETRKRREREERL